MISLVWGEIIGIGKIITLTGSVTMEDSAISYSQNVKRQHHKFNKTLNPLVTLLTTISILLIGLLSACGPSPEELAAFQTVTAIAAFTPTPLPSPTQAGITSDQDLTSIIESATDGDVITLAPGVFTLTHGLNLNKNLTLIGAGAAQTTITTTIPYSEITTMLMFSGSGTLTFKGIKMEYAGNDPAAVLFMQSGNLVLEDCILTGATLSASGKQNGAISMANDATAVIRNSQIAGSLNRMDPENPQKIPGGIFLAGTNKLNLEGSSITDSYIGVYAYGQAQVTITGGRLSHNYSALTLLETATASISDSIFSNCLGSCIVTVDDSQATISDNTFRDAPERLAIQVTGNSKAQIIHNAFTNFMSAIIFMDNASGEAVENTLEGFNNIGIVVESSSAPTLSNNIFSPGTNNQEKAIGILYQDSAAGEARDNHFSNLFLGISVKDDASPLLDSNTIGSCFMGISYSGNAKGIANKNIIRFGETGILIDAPALPVITNNSIQAYSFALSSDPEDWINQLNTSGNDLTSGPPEIVVVTITPTP
ncbi:MAG TPA: hypothetical protein DDW19_08050 [Anaerolineaceae bacterium]|nr:hypothetical protein [Anaerolineaceae bacterium]